MASTVYYQKFDVPNDLSNRNLQKIINFYLFQSPVPDTSARSKTFEEYGFRGKRAFSALKAAMLKSATASLAKNYKPCKRDELEEAFRSIEVVSPPDEYCVFLKHDERTVMTSLFSAIRNAFAHGCFNMKTYNKVKIYFFLNYHGYKKAQIVLQEKTLLTWMELIQSGYGALHTNKSFE